MNGELLKRFKTIDDKQKEKLAKWLHDGHGHSTCGPEWFTERGVPQDFVSERVSRSWSNFVFLPDGCDEVAVDAATSKPIGLMKKNWGEPRWEFLITPQQSEVGYYELPSRSNDVKWITEEQWCTFFDDLPDEVKEMHSHLVWGEMYADDDYSLLISAMIEGKYETMIEGKYENITIDSKLYGVEHYHQWPECSWDNACDEMYLRLALGSKITPELDYEGNELTFKRDDCLPFLTRAVAGKRLDFIDMNKVWNYGVYEKGQGLDMDSIEKEVDEYIKRFKDEPNLLRFGGKNIATAEEWRTLSRKELIQRHVDDREEELEFYQRCIDEWEVKAPGCLNYVHSRYQKNRRQPIPKGWGMERAKPLGYMDCMWNGNYFVPWVDGVGATSMMTSLCREFDVDAESGMIGRGSHGRAVGEKLTQFFKDNDVLKEDEEE